MALTRRGVCRNVCGFCPAVGWVPFCCVQLTWAGRTTEEEGSNARPPCRSRECHIVHCSWLSIFSLGIGSSVCLASASVATSIKGWEMEGVYKEWRQLFGFSWRDVGVGFMTGPFAPLNTTSRATSYKGALHNLRAVEGLCICS